MSTHPFGPSTHPGAPEGLSLGSVLTMLRRRKLLLIVPLVLALAAAGAVSYLMPPRYRAEALVTSAPIVPLEPQKTDPTIEGIESRIAAIRAILFRRSVLEPVVVDLDLAPHAGGRVHDDDLEDVRRRIGVRVDGDDVLALSFEGQTAKQAEAAASRLATILATWSNGAQKERAEAAARFLESQLPAVRARVDEGTTALEEYQKRWNGELPDRASTTLKLMEGAQARLQQLGATRAEDESRAAALRTEIAELERQGVTSAGSRPAADPRVAEQRVLVAQLLRRYTPEHPDVKRAKEELEALQSASGSRTGPDESPLGLRYRQLRTDLAAAEARLAGSRAEESELTSESSGYKSRLESAPRHEAALATMKRESEEARLHYQSLLDRLHEAQLTAQLANSAEGAAFRILEPPRAPDRPFAPRYNRIMLMGLLSGIAIGGAAVLVREQLDSSIRGAEELESTTSRPVLVTIPRAPAGTGAAMIEDPHGVVAEQYRILAAKLVQSNVAMRPMSILVTSAIGGEGKTTTAVNLSLALARFAPGQVLLVDADFGRPAVHKMLGLPPGDGLRRLLKDPEQDPLRFMREHEGISILEAGGASNSLRAALASPAAQRLFMKLRQQFPFVVVDAPPVLAVAESFLLQRMLTCCLFVVRAGYTPRETASRAMQSLDTSRIVGVVLNDVGRENAYAYPYVVHQAETAALPQECA